MKKLALITWALCVLTACTTTSPQAESSGSSIIANSKLALSLEERTEQEFDVYEPVKGYGATVAIANHKTILSQNPVIISLGINLDELHGDVDATRLLSKYARDWAYAPADKNGPNCFHAALAATNPEWEHPRYVDDFEFAKHMDDGATTVLSDHKWSRGEPLTDLRFGDIIVFLCAELGWVHAAVYVGEANGEPVVFQKTGHDKRLPYGFFKLSDTHDMMVKNHAHTGDDLTISAFRLKGAIVDPYEVDPNSSIIAVFPESP